MATNGITDPRDPGFIPYYERQGLAADGVSSEFMETWRKKSSEILARTRPESREAVRIGLGEFAQGQYANLRNYEMREVRRGKVDALTRDAEESVVRTAWSVVGQAAADLRQRDEQREDAQKEYEEVARLYPQSFVDVMENQTEKENAQKWLKEAAERRDERLTQADASFAERTRNHFFEMIDGVEETGKRFDAGVSEMLFDEHEGVMRKRKAARAAIGSVVESLIAGGSLEAAEKFVDSLMVEKDADGKTPVAARYGFLPDDVGKMRDAVKSAHARMKAEAAAAAAEVRKSVARDFTVRELQMRDMPQELWESEYERMGNDQTLRDVDPERATAYLDEARKMRAAAEKAKRAAAKAEIEANEDNLASALCQLQVLELEGSIQQDAANEAQAAIWRKFRTCTLGRTVSPTFMQTFKNRMETRLSDQEANAMRKFYRAFGYTPDLQSGGDVGATERNAAKKDSTDYYAPLEEDGQKVETRKTRIKASELLRYGDSLLRTLRALGPDMNREGVVEREIARLRTGWMKGEIDKNRDATVRSVMDMQREARARLAAAQEETSAKENDDGRNGEQEASK